MRLYRQELASNNALIIIISAIVSVLGTRLFLEAAGYPIIGRGMWHLSHTIWGGILMIVGMFMVVSFYGRKNVRVSCAIFGVGMGMFMDEIGKFVTRDNNYFFKPTSMMIYILFLILFGIYRLLVRQSHENGMHLFYHVLDRLGDLAENDLDEREQKKLVEIMQLLRSRSHYELATFSHELEKALSKLSPKQYNQSLTRKITRKILGGVYKKVLSKKGVLIFLIVLTSIYSIGSIADTVWLMSNIRNIDMSILLGNYSPANGFEAYLLVVKILSDLLVAGMFLLGIGLTISRRYKSGLDFFEDGLIIYILLTTVCRFYFEQFNAVLGLMFSLLVLVFIRQLKVEKKAESGII